MLADRTKSLSIIAYAQGLVTMIDFIFTLVSFLVALASPDTSSLLPDTSSLSIAERFKNVKLRLDVKSFTFLCEIDVIL